MNQFQLAFTGENTHVPFWFMRQAGRYLPEYRAIREKSGGFLDMCYSPDKASEVTLQPLRRFPLNAAIIFSDILVIPHALGKKLEFEVGEGPKLEIIKNISDVPALDIEAFKKFLEPVYTALQQTKKQLSDDTTLIGFTGAPWTLMCYLLQGKGGKEFAVAREQIYAQEEAVEKLTNVLVDAIALHLIGQVKAGATALQIFDSWSGLVPFTHVKSLIIEPTRRIVEKVKAACPHIPIIGFPRGLGQHLGEYAEQTGVDGIGVDSFTDIDFAKKSISEKTLIQGNLDPLLLASSLDKTVSVAKEITEKMQGRKFIFNLGHGIVPHTPIANVEALSQFLHQTRA
jgi:uroporphyrinogen decarboxylase